MSYYLFHVNVNVFGKDAGTGTKKSEKLNKYFYENMHGLCLRKNSEGKGLWKIFIYM